MKNTSTNPRGATTYKETSFGIVPRSKLLKLELEGTKKGLEFIHNLFSQNTNIQITPQLILDIHRESFGWIFPDWAGKFRLIRVEFSGKEAVQPHKIPELVNNLCSDLNERLLHLSSLDDNFINQVVELLAWFQHRFIWIHPFQDYNGRIARMLTIVILLKLNLPPIEVKADTRLDRKKYLESMYAADNDDLSKLEKLIGDALSDSLSKGLITK